MSRCDEDHVLFPELLSTEGTGLARRRELPILPRDAVLASVTSVPAAATITAIASAVLDSEPTLLGRLFPGVRRRQALQNLEMAIAIARAGRMYLNEIQGIQRDMRDFLSDMAKGMGELERYAATLPIRIDIDVEQLLATRDRLREERLAARAIRRTSATLLNDAHVASSPPAAAPRISWDSTDDLSVRAKTVTIQGIANAEAERIEDAPAAFAAGVYLRNRNEGASDDAARLATFADVRAMLGADKLRPEELAAYNASLKKVRAEYTKKRDQAAGAGFMASAVTGRRTL